MTAAIISRNLFQLQDELLIYILQLFLAALKVLRTSYTIPKDKRVEIAHNLPAPGIVQEIRNAKALHIFKKVCRHFTIIMQEGYIRRKTSFFVETEKGTRQKGADFVRLAAIPIDKFLLIFGDQYNGKHIIHSIYIISSNCKDINLCL